MISINRLQRIIKLKFIKLMRIQDKLERIARGFAWGTFLAIFPSYPFNTLLSFLAPLFGGNILAAIIGAWVVGPFITTPFWYYVSYIFGKQLFQIFDLPVNPISYNEITRFLVKFAGDPVNLSLYYFITQEGFLHFWNRIKGFFWATEIGGFIIGIIGAIVSYKCVILIERWFIKYKKNLKFKKFRRLKFLSKKAE
ncbi:MAG TPA: DUF2062 domain-containing protein [bacterium]|nr:DUF2062 domain-containing protein [bacterium]